MRGGVLVGLAVVVLAMVAGLAVVVAGVGGETMAAVVVGVVTGVLGPALSAGAAWLWRNRRWREITSAAEAGRVLDGLADEVRAQWREEARVRRLRDAGGPAAARRLGVRWEWAAGGVTGRPEDAVAAGGFAPLAGLSATTADDLREGGLEELFRIYGGLASGRMVVLGGPGAGKTAAGVLTVLRALEHRRGLAEAERGGVPVPVLLTPYGWDARRPLADWVAERLTRTYPVLRAGEHGPDTARRLLAEGHVAVFLDGFDEMAPRTRAAALRAIDEQADFRIVLLARTAEFAAAVPGGHLRDAAALRLRPVPPRAAADYLARWQVDPAPPAWRRVIDRLRDAPDSPFARALSSPLAVTLLRDARLDDAEMDALLDADRFGTAAAVEEHLLDRVLPVAYDRADHRLRAYDVADARRWLGRTAARMSAAGTRDLAWWRTHEWTPRAARVLAMTVVGGLLAAAAAALVGTVDTFGERTTAGPGPAAAAGLVLGFALGWAAEYRGRAGTRPAAFRPGMAAVAGLAVGMAALLTVGPALGPWPALAVAGGAALATGGAVGLTSGNGPGWSPRRAVGRSGRTGAVAEAFVRGLPTGLATAVPVALATGIPLGLRLGAVAGVCEALATGLAFLVAFALIDGRSGALPALLPTVIDPVTAWRHDVRRSVSIGVVFGAAVGGAAGVTDAIIMASHETLPVALGVGAVTAVALGAGTAVAAALTVSDAWRTAISFGLLWLRGEAPLRTLRFLEDAHRREVLRVVGPFYQFRHATLQDRLAPDRV